MPVAVRGAAALALALLLAGASSHGPAAPAVDAGSPGFPRGAASAGSSFLRAEDYRVLRVGYRIGVGARRFCSDSYPLTGMLLHHLADYERRDQAAVIAEFGLDRGPSVLAVVEGSPAAEAGLLAGDLLLSVNGSSFASPLRVAEIRDEARRRMAVEATEAQLETQLRLGAVTLQISRKGREFSVRLSPRSGCPVRVRLAPSPRLNAFAIRGYAIVTTRLLAAIRSDDELAIALGHEIAHNVLKHMDRLEEMGVPSSGMLRRIGKNAALVRATEAEADRLGLKLAWAAGYDPSAAIPYRRRMEEAHGGSGQFSTHPSAEERERLLREVLAELGVQASDPSPQRP
jgi:hypothetical protein